jgi:hypothetical protein
MHADWDYDRMIRKLRAGDYAAVISDDTQLTERAYNDRSCSLHLLKDPIEPFDLALAFAADFGLPQLRQAINSAILHLQESGELDVRLRAPCMHAMHVCHASQPPLTAPAAAGNQGGPRAPRAVVHGDDRVLRDQPSAGACCRGGRACIHAHGGRGW